MKIITSVVNNPIFIRLQYHTFKKYCKCDYEFIVFNDAKDFPDSSNGGNIAIRKQIQDVCSELNIKCINIKNDHHINISNFSYRHADAFSQIMNYISLNIDKYFIIDSDVFLIDDFDFKEYEDKKLCGILHCSHGPANPFKNVKFFYYTALQLTYIDYTKIKNKELLMCWKPILGFADTGAESNKWLSKEIENLSSYSEKDLRDNTINGVHFYKRHLSSLCWNKDEAPENIKNKENLMNLLKQDPRNKNDKFFCELFNDKFLHYRAGSNWMNEGLQFHFAFSKALYQVLLE